MIGVLRINVIVEQCSVKMFKLMLKNNCQVPSCSDPDILLADQVIGFKGDAGTAVHKAGAAANRRDGRGTETRVSGTCFIPGEDGDPV